MSKEKANIGMSNSDGAVYELRDKTGQFYDPESKFEIARDEQKAVEEPMGRQTTQFIAGGGLVEVGQSGTSDEGQGTSDQTEDQDPDALPDDFPGREVLSENKLTTRAAIAGMDRDALIGLKGIGEKTADAILAYK